VTSKPRPSHDSPAHQRLRRGVRFLLRAVVDNNLRPILRQAFRQQIANPLAEPVISARLPDKSNKFS
jgi:hypothetical protein